MVSQSLQFRTLNRCALQFESRTQLENDVFGPEEGATRLATLRDELEHLHGKMLARFKG